MLACAYEADAALPLVQPAGAGTDVALHTAVVETVPVLGRDRAAGVPHEKKVDSGVPRSNEAAAPRSSPHCSRRVCGTRIPSI